MKRGGSRINPLRYLIYLLLLSIPALYTARSLHPPHSYSALPSGQSGIVTYVYDGDTIKVRLHGGEKRVRLIGVDAPEVGDPAEEVDLWARLARRLAHFYLYQKQVYLSFEKEKEDRYGRLLAFIWIEGQTLFNELIIREGLARYLAGFSLRPEMRRRLQAAEEEARREGKGMWQEAMPIPIKAQQARNHLGQLQAVLFTCVGVRTERNYTLLLSREGDFQVFIPKDRRSLFSFLDTIKSGSKVVVYGVVEEYRGRPQISLFFPRQLILSPSGKRAVSSTAIFIEKRGQILLSERG